MGTNIEEMNVQVWNCSRMLEPPFPPPSPSNTRQTRPRYVQPFVSGGAGIDNSLRFLADAPDWKIGAAQSCHLGVCIFVGRQLGLNSNPPVLSPSK